MKKKGVSMVKAIERMRCTNTLSRTDTPAITSPTRYAGNTSLALGGRRKAPEEEPHQEDEFDLGLADPAPPSAGDPARRRLHLPEHKSGNDDENPHPNAKAGEQYTECHHGAEIGNKAGR